LIGEEGGIKKAPKLWQYNTKSFEEKTNGTIEKRAQTLASFFSHFVAKREMVLQQFSRTSCGEREMLQGMARQRFEATRLMNVVPCRYQSDGANFTNKEVSTEDVHTWRTVQSTIHVRKSSSILIK
jgi:hypothetical protein